MGILKGLISIILPIDDMTKPQSKRETESPQQAYDRLISSRNLTTEEQVMLQMLHKALGKEKWD